KGRVVKTSTLQGFLLIYMVASLKPLRPRSLRYQVEQAHLEAWLESVLRYALTNYDLALEVAAARNLVKGYGDTHERGRACVEPLHQRHEERQRDQHHADLIDEAAEEQQDQHHADDDGGGGQPLPRHQRHDPIGGAGEAQHLREGRRAENDEQDRARHRDGAG